jgi:IS5 family transposase
VKIAQDKGTVTGRRMRVDVVETNINYPTDSTLLGDGVRVLTGTMKRITDIVGAVGCATAAGSVKLRVLEIMRIARAKGWITAVLSPIARYDEPGCRAGEALLE